VRKGLARELNSDRIAPGARHEDILHAGRHGNFFGGLETALVGTQAHTRPVNEDDCSHVHPFVVKPGVSGMRFNRGLPEHAIQRRRDTIPRPIDFHRPVYPRAVVLSVNSSHNDEQGDRLVDIGASDAEADGSNAPPTAAATSPAVSADDDGTATSTGTLLAV